MNAIGILTIIFSVLTVLGVVLSLLFNVKIKKLSLYWMISLIGALIVVFINFNNIESVLVSLIENTAINPVKILIFFLCMTILSLILENLNFFSYLASKSSRLAKNSQYKLFLIFYCIVSVLTVFTSNDIVILSFVPFICHFCKKANINPAPYVFSTFVAANTWSMMLVIGNPTNVYLASFAGIDFITYFLKMALPTVACGVFSFCLLLLIFNKHLKVKIEYVESEEERIDKPMVIFNVIILIICTILLTISSYIGLEMWYIALGFAALSLIINLLICVIKKKDSIFIKRSLKKVPWEFVPFLLSMFLIIMCLDVNGITKILANLLVSNNEPLVYGLLSFVSSNILNNIPMTALFSSMLSYGTPNILSVYAAIVGSNLGAILTPIGALAGIMFINLLREKGVNFSIKSFIKYGVLISITSLLLMLSLIIFI